MTDLARAIIDAILDQADMDGCLIRSRAEERVRDVLDTAKPSPPKPNASATYLGTIDEYRDAKHKTAIRLHHDYIWRTNPLLRALKQKRES